jgi:DNA-binding NtrC family response regulator
MRQLESGTFDIIVVGQGSRDLEGRCVLEGATAFNRRLPVVVAARHLEMGCYLEAMQLGAVDYLAGAFGSAEIARVIRTWAPRCKGSVEAEKLTPGLIPEKLAAWSFDFSKSEKMRCPQ